MLDPKPWEMDYEEPKPWDVDYSPETAPHSDTLRGSPIIPFPEDNPVLGPEEKPRPSPFPPPRQDYFLRATDLASSIAGVKPEYRGPLGPIIQTPDFQGADFASGLANSVKSGIESAGSPVGIATLPLLSEEIAGRTIASLARPVLTGTFAGLGAKGAGEAAGTLAGTPDPTGAQVGKAVGDIAQSGLMMLAPTVEPILEGLRKETPATEVAQPKESDASTQQEATAVHGPLREQSGTSERKMPAEEGGARVQSQAEGGLQEAKVAPSIESVVAMPGQEFAKFSAREGNRGLTEKAYELADSLRDSDPSDLDKAKEQATEQAQSAKDKIADAPQDQKMKFMEDALALSMKRQYFDEAAKMSRAIKQVEGGKSVSDVAKDIGVSEKALAGLNKPLEVKPELDPFESFLNKAIDFTDPGQQLGGGRVSLGIAKLPVWLAKEVAHGSLKVIRAAYRAGKDTAKAIESGIEWLRDQKIKGFDENEARTWFSNSIKSKGSDVTGIAQRVREKVAAAGQEALPPSGEGISAPDSVERGEQLLKLDNDSADKAMTAFERDPNRAVSADAMAVTRAKLRQLAQAARTAEAKFGVASDEYKKAWKERSDWAARIKPMQTEWHKTGMAQQGEQDIDTGTFTGLREAYTDATGKDFTPEQADTAKDLASKNNGAQNAVDSAKTKLNGALRESFSMDAAEKRAFDAANKTVRENAIRIANAKNKGRVTEAILKRAADQVQLDADARAKAAADKVVRENAIRISKVEAKKGITEAARQKEIDKIQQERDSKVKAITDKAARDRAATAAKAEVDARVNPEKRVWEKFQQYLDQGMDSFDDIRTKAATDLGMTVKQVTDLLTKNKRTKFLADDLWRKQEALRRFKAQAQRWLKSTAIPKYQQALAIIPRTLFALKVGFHGTVALGTHAPMVFFQPPKWGIYFRDFGKMYRMVGSPKYYEMQVQELLRRPNYIRARRAGLVNDPTSYEDYNSPLVSQYIGRLSGMGNRGYSVLKILRQDMFDQHWNSLPKTAQIDEMASAIADGVNHATGVVKGAAPKGANIALFAPRLEASRVMWLAGDPLRAVNTFATWKTADIAEKEFAINQVKEKAWVAGTLLGLLALNQGVLSATGSKQKVNFDDPFHSDWLKFKVGGMTASYGNPMLTMARLPIRLYKIRESDGGKLKNVIYPDENSYTILGEYARSQMSPFMSLASDLWLKGDWQNRPLPNSTRPVPKRLRAQGVYPYTWPEFWTEQVLPIPAEEAAREVWGKGMGMNAEQIKSARKAMATIAIMSGTGARLTDDVQSPPAKR